jgi:hypothetical protein
LRCTEQTVRNALHAFHQRGLAAVVSLHPAANYYKHTRPTYTGTKRPRGEGSHGITAALSPLVTPSQQAVRTHGTRSGPLP